MPSIIRSALYGDLGAVICSPPDPAAAQPISEAGDSVLNAAYAKARSIVNAASLYSRGKIREERERATLECVQLKKQAREEGHESGFADGLREGKRQGFDEGYEAGLRRAAEETERLESRWNTLLRQTGEARDAVLEQARGDLADLAVSIARCILKKELAVSAEAVMDMVSSALSQYAEQPWVRVHLSPDMARQLEDKAQAAGVKLKPSPSLKDADCVIELPDEILDISPQTQLDRIQAALRG